MRDVAALAGVSFKTVSRVINGVSTVDPELVARVNTAADRLGYRPNLTASNLRRSDGRTATIGTLVEDAANPFSALLLRAIDGKQSEPDLQLHDAKAGDRYLLCSDGLYSVVSMERLQEVLSTVADPDDVVRQLIDLANQAGGPDNITCVVADVVEL